MNTPPLHQFNSMRAARYFGYGAELLKVQPPRATDWSILARMQRIGLEPGKSFDLAGPLRRRARHLREPSRTLSGNCKTQRRHGLRSSTAGK
jgi:hypothetical protein